ncbi:MAG: hypothetical protein K8R77_02200 [Anaerolineaceae bacterium]|nr:hypothetical protein [Anaerolineaceae bacterium]
MKTETARQKRFFLFRKPDIFLAVLGVVTGTAEIFVSNYFHLNRAYFGYTILAACLFYLASYRVFASVQDEEPTDLRNQSAFVFILFSCLSLAFLLVSVLLLRASNSYLRGIDYISLFLGAVVFTVVQIVFFDTSAVWKQRLILGQILLLGIGFKASGFFQYPTLMGNDPFYHLDLIERFIDTRQFPQGEAYSSFPLFHVLVTVFSLLSSLDLKSSFFIISVMQSLSLLSVFLIGKVLFDQKTGLLAFLFLSLSDYQLQWGIQIIPMTVGIIVFALLLMSVVLRNRYRKRFRTTWTVILILLIVVMIFIHTLSTLILVLSVIILFLAFVFFQDDRNLQGRLQFISLTFVLIASVAPVVHWSYNATVPEQTFLARVVLTVRMSLREAYLGDVQMVSGAGFLSEWQVFLGDLGWVMLLLLTVVGILGCLRLFSKQATIMALIVLTCVLIFTTYGGAFIGLRQILPARWISFLYIPACIFSAFGIKQLLCFNSPRSDRALVQFFKKSWLALLVILTVGAMTTSPLRSMPDSPLYLEELSIRPGFYNAEVTGRDQALARQQAGQIAASSKTGRYLKDISEVDPREADTYQDSAFILVRQFDLRNGFFIPYPDYQVSDYVLPTKEFDDYLTNSCWRSYDNGEVFLYTVEE